MATVLVDLLLQVSAASVALRIGGWPLLGDLGPKSSMLVLALTYGALWAGGAYATKLYRGKLRRSLGTMWRDRARVSLVVFAAIGVIVLLGAASPVLGQSAMWTLGLACAVSGLLGASIEMFLIPNKWQRERALLIGTEESIARSAKRLDEHPRRLDVVGTLAVELEEVPCTAQLGTGAGNESRVIEHVKGLDASVVVLTTDAYLLGMHPMELIWGLESTGAVLVMDTGMHTMPSHRVGVERVGGLVAVQARRRANRTAGSVLSGGVQWCAALLGLVLLSPVFAALAVWIKLDSHGPAFFVQERVGKYGKPFRMYKFRSMVDGAHRRVHELRVDPDAPDRGPLVKAKNDHRITRAGRWLRASSLDELPQLLNVVRGDMRLVGPRPALPKEVAQYRGYEVRRLACKPGLTGLWQVSGRSDLDWVRSVELDQTYIDGHSLGLDTYIVCRTPGAVVSSRGAY